MNPIFTSKLKNPEDSFQNHYRYAPYPSLYKGRRGEKPFTDNELKQMHHFINPAILKDVRSTSTIDSCRIKYEFLHVERGPFMDLVHAKIIELLKEVKVW
jgi:hypothetical protein